MLVTYPVTQLMVGVDLKRLCGLDTCDPLRICYHPIRGINGMKAGQGLEGLVEEMWQEEQPLGVQERHNYSSVQT